MFGKAQTQEKVDAIITISRLLFLIHFEKEKSEIEIHA